MSLKLPSILDSDLSSVYAADEETYLFQNVNDLPDDVLINQCLPLPENLSARSIKIPGTAKPGFSEIYRNAALPNGLKESLTPELNTYPKIFASSAKRQADSPCLAYHEYDYENDQHKERYAYFTYKQVDERKTNFANGLMYLLETNPYKDLALESHQKIVNHSKGYKNYNKDNTSFIVTIYSSNRVEWLLTDLACSANSITNTALYDTLGPTSSKFILGLTQSPVVVCSKEKIETLVKLKTTNPNDLKSLITIISMDPLNVKGKDNESLIKLAEENNIKLYDFNQVEKVGEAFPRKITHPSPETVYTFTFTSGTTGANPKGVVLTQRSVACALSAFAMLLPHHKHMAELAFLPLAHIFERQMSAAILSVGGNVGFCRLGGTPLTLFEDMKLFKPTFFANVPRIFTKMEATIKAATIDSSSKANGVTKGQNNEYIFDKALIEKLRSKFGFDNVEFCITGSAPIASETIKFLRASLGIGFILGYGSSESFAGMCMALPFHSPSIGTCGALTPTVEARLRELPEMGYYLNDKGGPRGELQLRGPQMFTHYYKNEEETNKSFDSEGWFSTGDVAQFTNEGWIIIFDRVKNFFKLSQGEYVTPEKIENLYLSSNPILSQAFVHGNSTESFLVGIIGVDPVGIVNFLTENCNIPKSQLDTNEKILQVCNRREIRTQLLLQLNTTVGSVLNGFEKLANVFIDFEPLKLEREVVTPTSKIRRPIASRYFKSQIDAMYKEGSLLRNLKL
ncbi:AMP-binding enzyme family protein [Candida parapsilosis]|uniref:AMP-binding domain-containing protein n=2 Tax=Candida parapsilosis TaxID=5480 RepID=G8BAB7_CANPC|nr:uncharacterized protein CPAR2_805390 [Candida parapsilosis]KAF6051889.1 AMP-binding enzyme family protein [Candida parapsilosis]KAF6052614.1 AMP-binding enzyme family protein [Candida parapsilosis]KAF6053691.1 AMP-binding enzyme family protein [Candida parapsilosis]KAF6064390.1 AMP-binding enzyme family protein [Candida parapsilosis]KAI5905819.1 Long-chain-fatty-acid--CoA ligase 2 [Candida parapsilosis]